MFLHFFHKFSLLVILFSVSLCLCVAICVATPHYVRPGARGQGWPANRGCRRAGKLLSCRCQETVGMIDVESLKQAIGNLSARIVAIRDSL